MRRREGILPLAMFPEEDRLAILEAIKQPTPPEKWIDFGVAKIESRAWYEWHWARGIDPDRRRTSLTPAVRAAVIDRDGYVCDICGGDVEPDDVHIDHVWPVSRGGTSALNNLQVTHSRCNIVKGAQV